MHLNMGGFPTQSLPVLIQMLGKDTARSEELTANEIGYRYQVNRRLWFDVAAFYNNYDALSMVEQGDFYFEAQPAPAHLVMPLFFENNGFGSTYGGELTSQYQANDALVIKGGFSLLRMDLDSTSGATAPQDHEGQSPRYQANIGSTLKVTDNVEVSGQVFRVDALPYFNVPAYTRVDANTMWQATSAFGVKVVGTNLLGSHIEFGDLPSPSNEVSRSVRGELVVRF
jgi:iron complex outermembrane receptor protein